MPAQTRSRGKPSAATTYRSTSAAPKQQEFPHRRQTVKKTYGRSRPKRDMKQETLTQFDFTSSAMRDFVELEDDDEEEEEEAKVEGEVEEAKRVKLEPPRPAEKATAKAKSRSSRRRTAGEELYVEEKPRQSKRRKTLGDSPISSVSSSFHTQTLTQMMSTNDKDADPWQIEDSQDDEDSKLVMETPKKVPRQPGESEAQQDIDSAVPSLIKSATPANRQKRTEIPSTQSPATPMLLRYSPAPHPSPLMTKSTNIGALSPILKTSRKTPRNAVIPDSYSTAHDSSPAHSEKSTVKATPSKRLRFNLPEDKENITPGRTKPKSPKPKSQSTGRRPLQEVPDSDEELEDPDETEYETEEDEYGARDPESPTPKRFHNTILPPIEDAEPELESSQTVDHPIERAVQQVVASGSRLSSLELGLEIHDEITSASEIELPASPDSGLQAREPHLAHPNTVIESHVLSQEPNLEPDTEVQVQTPETPRAEQSIIELDSTSTLDQSIESPPSGQDENEDAEDDLPMSQDYLYTQGLESQRLPLDSIRALGPQTPHSDIMVSLHPEHIARIVDRSKNHEFRAWKIPQQVSRIWVYITRPDSELKYMCRFGEPKIPGEIEDETGAGNVEFNQGKSLAKFAYEILQVYELNNPVSLDEMKRKGWVAGAPQKYTYIPPAVVGELTANLRCALFEDKSQSQSVTRQDISESQELKAQLQSDADYNTQHYSEETIDEIIPASQSPRKDNSNSEDVSNRQHFARPALSRVRSTSSNPELPSLPPSQRQRSFVRASQATTVSQVSSSPAISPGKSRHPIPLPSSSPAMLRRIHSSLRSSQLPTTSQMLPDSLLNDDIQAPPPIVWDSADENSD